jgi:Peptidase family S41
LPYISFRQPNDPARLAADSALQLVSGAAAVILDLRYAIGGYPEMAGYIVSAFTAPDADIYNVFHGRGDRESERPKQPYPTPRVDVPLYVLVSGITASAAESTAYTLQAAKRAIIVGERTSGAANPGGMLPVGGGFNVFVSNSTPINPVTGTNWEGKGVQPDITIPAEQSLERAHILALQDVLKKGGGSAAREVQWALEYLTTKDQPPVTSVLREYAGSYADAIVSIVEGQLSVRRQRHPAMLLRQLSADAFMVVDEPSLRVVFERGEGKAVSGFQLLRASGYSIWHPRRQ